MTDPSYRDVAEWLPTDIREHIEATTPCPVHGRHQWEQGPSIVFHVSGREEPIRVDERWRCCGCGLVHTTDPEKWR